MLPRNFPTRGGVLLSSPRYRGREGGATAGIRHTHPLRHIPALPARRRSALPGAFIFLAPYQLPSFPHAMNDHQAGCPLFPLLPASCDAHVQLRAAKLARPTGASSGGHLPWNVFIYPNSGPDSLPYLSPASRSLSCGVPREPAPWPPCLRPADVLRNMAAS
ncbi:hypothetical protein BD310DRAFT_235798 [Dichomitus squalens]|uniref:Uncharacterized protein n=1 Tax=Dichomitus squalens TaxID=114155 RepID=A0A4Q9Q1L6_9APHY|nr:hypothetical protein BD310DRAFT_235798 [Dichomitus squalens]